MPEYRQTGFGDDRRRSTDVRSGDSYRPGLEPPRPFLPKLDRRHTLPPKPDDGPSRSPMEGVHGQPLERDVQRPAPLTVNTCVPGPNFSRSSPASGHPETSTPRSTASSNKTTDKKARGMTESDKKQYNTLYNGFEEFNSHIFKQWVLRDQLERMDRKRRQYQDEYAMTARDAESHPSIAEQHKLNKEKLDKVNEDIKNMRKQQDKTKSLRKQTLNDLIINMISSTKSSVDDGKESVNDIVSEKHSPSQIEIEKRLLSELDDKLSAQQTAFDNRLLAQETAFDNRLLAQKTAFDDRLQAQETAFEKQLSTQREGFEKRFAAVDQQLQSHRSSLDTLSTSLSTQQEDHEKKFRDQKKIDQQLTTACGDLTKRLSERNDKTDSLFKKCNEMSRKVDDNDSAYRKLQNNFIALETSKNEQESAQGKIRTDLSDLKRDHHYMRDTLTQLKGNYDEWKKERKTHKHLEREQEQMEVRIQAVTSHVNELASKRQMPQGQVDAFAKHQKNLEARITDILPRIKELESVQKEHSGLRDILESVQRGQSDLRDTPAETLQQSKHLNWDRMSELLEWFIDHKPQNSFSQFEKALSTLADDMKSLQFVKKEDMEAGLKHLYRNLKDKIAQDAGSTIESVNGTIEVVVQELEGRISRELVGSKEPLSQLGNRVFQLESRQNKTSELEREFRSLKNQGVPQMLQKTSEDVKALGAKHEGFQAHLEALSLAQRSLNTQVANVQTKGIANEVLQQLSPYGQQTVQHLVKLQRKTDMIEQLPELIKEIKRLKDQLSQQQSLLSQIAEASGVDPTTGKKRAAESNINGGPPKRRILSTNGHTSRSPSLRATSAQSAGGS